MTVKTFRNEIEDFLIREVMASKDSAYIAACHGMMQHLKKINVPEFTETPDRLAVIKQMLMRADGTGTSHEDLGRRITMRFTSVVPWADASDEEKLIHATEYAKNSYKAVLAEGIGSCFYCVSTQVDQELLENAIVYRTGDQYTMLCPRCQVPAMLPGELNREFLKSISAYWFQRHNDALVKRYSIYGKVMRR